MCAGASRCHFEQEKNRCSIAKASRRNRERKTDLGGAESPQCASQPGWLKLKNAMPHPFGNRSSCSFLSHVALLPWVSLLCAWLFNQKLSGWVEGRSDVILSRRKKVQHCCLQPVLVFFVILVFRLTASFDVELPQSAPQPDLSKKATPHA